DQLAHPLLLKSLISLSLPSRQAPLVATCDRYHNASREFALTWARQPETGGDPFAGVHPAPVAVDAGWLTQNARARGRSNLLSYRKVIRGFTR
ncbi:MAG: hypothetical protein ACRET3_06585, partial [Burkholderiales bacterium]